MSAHLHSLKLNCILATSVVAVVGALAVAVGWWEHARSLRQSEETAQERAISAAALQPTVDAATRLSLHTEWTACAILRIDGDTVTVLERAGAVPPLKEPGPDIVQASQAVHVWYDDALGVAAAPCPHTGSSPSVMIAWWKPAAAPSPWPWTSLIIGVLLVGGGLGLYLVARVYRPVVWLEQAARAAAEGRAPPPDEEHSEETAALHSSISTLVERSQHPDAR
ncbi:MAG: hypothetical protein AAB263_02420 [Planctomycetota bacterium]